MIIPAPLVSSPFTNSLLQNTLQRVAKRLEAASVVLYQFRQGESPRVACYPATQNQPTAAELTKARLILSELAHYKTPERRVEGNTVTIYLEIPVHSETYGSAKNRSGKALLALTNCQLWEQDYPLFIRRTQLFANTLRSQLDAECLSNELSILKTDLTNREDFNTWIDERLMRQFDHEWHGCLPRMFDPLDALPINETEAEACRTILNTAVSKWLDRSTHNRNFAQAVYRQHVSHWQFLDSLVDLVINGGTQCGRIVKPFPFPNRQKGLPDGERLEVHCDLSPGIRIFANEENVVALVSELCSNVSAFAPHGKVNITADSIPCPAAGPNGLARIIVSDEGPGIAPEYLSKCTDSSWSTRPDCFEGLGLTIAKRVCESAGGTLTIENIEPHGLKVTAVFPADGSQYSLREVLNEVFQGTPRQHFGPTGEIVTVSLPPQLLPLPKPSTLSMTMHTEDAPDINYQRNTITLLARDIYQNVIDWAPSGKLEVIADVLPGHSTSSKQRVPDQARLIFRDSGPGMDEAHLEECLRVGWTSDPAHHEGVGLSRCYHICNRLQGSIKLENVAPHGLQVSFTLPLRGCRED